MMALSDALVCKACTATGRIPSTVWCLVTSCHFVSSPIERDLPEGLDQKIITWEMLQKENYLANLEKKKKESNEERLKKMSDK